MIILFSYLHHLEAATKLHVLMCIVGDMVKRLVQLINGKQPNLPFFPETVKSCFTIFNKLGPSRYKTVTDELTLLPKQTCMKLYKYHIKTSSSDIIQFDTLRQNLRVKIWLQIELIMRGASADEVNAVNYFFCAIDGTSNSGGMMLVYTIYYVLYSTMLLIAIYCPTNN